MAGKKMVLHITVGGLAPLLSVGGDLGEIQRRINFQLDMLNAGQPVDPDSLAAAAALCDQILDTIRRYIHVEAT